jgi:putative lipoic acid-binding regulatory protein
MTSVEIPGWSFKYDYIPSRAINVMVGVDRPTKLSITVTDDHRLKVFDTFVSIITRKLFDKTNSTFKTGTSGKDIGDFTFNIINPYLTERLYKPFSTVDPSQVSFKITCKSIHIGSSPELVLSRSEAKPMTYTLEFMCDRIEFSTIESNIIESVDKEGVVLRENTATLEEVEAESPQSTTSQKQLEKLLSVNKPAFSNLFFTNFDFGIDSEEFKNLNFDVQVESVSVEGYNLDYSFSEASIKNLFDKIRRPITISYTIIDNNKLTFLNAIYKCVRSYYYNDADGAFRRGSAGKYMSSTIVLYDTYGSNVPVPKYLVYATGMKILKTPSISLGYTGSEPIKYTFDVVCDNITFYNQDDLRASTRFRGMIVNG